MLRKLWIFVVYLSLCAISTTADFSDQCPETCDCKWANGKREADCSNAGFSAIPTHLNHEIQILRMSGNYVRTLGRDVFKNVGLVNLQRIFLDNCHLQEVHPSAFTSLTIMVELDLSRNNITNIGPDTFEGCVRLQTLDLSRNRLTRLHPYQFPRLKHLKSVDLSHNLLQELDRDTFANLGHSVEAVILNDNNLRTLSERIFLPLTNLKSLLLHSNPWDCDCRLKTFRRWVLDKGLYTYPTVCSEPERLADRKWGDVEAKDFACKPEISVPQSVVFSQPGANVTLGCFISGSPMPDAKWVLKGRIVTNNTVPAGGGGNTGNQNEGASNSPNSQSSSTLTPVENNFKPQPMESYYTITEEGGLERWFNLTISRVGLESVADYTCVAVNAGGVMEENVSLTFEEPEPVGLPGGKVQEESNLAIIIGAAAGGFFFVVVVLLTFCCCCCRRRIKAPHSSSPSSVLSRTPERHGSLMGFENEAHRSKHNLQSPVNRSNSGVTVMSNSSTSHGDYDHRLSQHMTHSGSSPMMNNSSVDLMGHTDPRRMPISPQAEMELQELQDLQQIRPKHMIVSTGINGGTQFHSDVICQEENQNGPRFGHFPDLIDSSQHHHHRVYEDPKSCRPEGQQQQPDHHPSPSKSQPLNPAALVVPPNPPPVFPHQFPHLIRGNGGQTLPHPGRSSKVPRSHSLESAEYSPQDNSQPLASPPALLTPPAAFSEMDHHQTHHQHQFHPQHHQDSHHHPGGYTTLPRQQQNQLRVAKGQNQHVNWAELAEASLSSTNQQTVFYDGVGPRTSATGGSSTLNSRHPPSSIHNDKNNQNMNQQFLHNPNQITTIPEHEEDEESIEQHLKTKRQQPSNNSTSQAFQQQNSGSKRRPSSLHRESSGSEVTIADDNCSAVSGYCEPFGKAVIPNVNTGAIIPNFTTKHKGGNRDSIASSNSSDMDGLLKGEEMIQDVHLQMNRVNQVQQQQQHLILQQQKHQQHSKAENRDQNNASAALSNKKCPLHKSSSSSSPGKQNQNQQLKIAAGAAGKKSPKSVVANKQLKQQQPKQLKGILKGGTMNKSEIPKAPQSTSFDQQLTSTTRSAAARSQQPNLKSAAASAAVAKPPPPNRTSSIVSKQAKKEKLDV